MKIVRARQEHLDRMCEITDQAKAQLKGLGLDQWQKGYPSREVWQQDIGDGCAYLAEEDGQIIGQFALLFTPDPSYGEIDGSWLSEGEYAAMHRVCVADGCKGKGVAGRMFAYGFERAREKGFSSMRIDTHPGNIPMQHCLARAGFRACGRIRLKGGCEDGDERIGFEALL